MEDRCFREFFKYATERRPSVKVQQIKVSPFSFQTILEAEFKKEVNEHGHAKVTGYIEEEKEQSYLQQSQQEIQVEVLGVDESGGEEILFVGILEAFQIRSENRLKIATIEVVSGTKIMDLVSKKYTFQDKNMTYRELLQGKTSIYPNANFVMTKGEGESLQKLVVQYGETDWVFIKRMASHFKTVVVPESTKQGTYFYFGVPEKSGSSSVEPIAYEVCKGVGNFLYKQENKVDHLLENDEIYYIVEDRENREIGEKISFLGKSLVVYETRAEWINGELKHWHTLKSEAGFQVPLYYNEKLIGVSLDGNIIDVQNDVVKVHAAVDDEQPIDKAKWFDYSTVYSSPDGTGWYAMPEKQDEIRLYFPTEKEQHGYIVSSVHVDEEESAAREYRTNPDDKSIKTKYEKEILLQPDRIIITNNKGLTIWLQDESGIHIQSTENVIVQADKDLSIISQEESIVMRAKESILFEQNGTSSIEFLENSITNTGAQVRVEELGGGQ